MITDRRKNIELWNGKETIGHIRLHPQMLLGMFAVISFEPSALKAIYGRRYERIHVPIITRCIFDDGVDYTIRRCLDVRRKSKRQRELLKSYEANW